MILMTFEYCIICQGLNIRKKHATLIYLKKYDEKKRNNKRRSYCVDIYNYRENIYVLKNVK